MLNNTSFKSFWSQEYATKGCYFFTREVSQRLAAPIAWLAHRLGLSPNVVTVIGLVVMLVGGFQLATASGLGGFLLSAALLQLGFAFDCADGQLARASGKNSEFGAWLDLAADFCRHVAILLAVYTVLVRELSDTTAAFAAFIWGAGNFVVLHTASQVRQGEYLPHQLQGLKASIKTFVRVFSDTPLVLLSLCVLLPFPRVLALYVTVIGCLGLVNAWALVKFRVVIKR